MRDEAFPAAEIERLGYSALPVGEGRWNGVAAAVPGRSGPVSRGLPGMTEARYVSADCGPLRVVSVYVPNGRAVRRSAVRLQAGVVRDASALAR